MSTNKTQHYHLHTWAAGDDFLRTEINENFAMLDEAVKTEADVLDAALKAEVNARTAAVTAEVNARKTAVSGEASARTSAINAAKNELKGQISTLNTALSRKAEILLGTYTGNGQTNRAIDLGRKVLAVLIEQNMPGLEMRGFAIQGQGYRGSGIVVTQTGFSLEHTTYFRINHDGAKYLYLAFVE